MKAKLAFSVRETANGQLELIGYIDKNEIEWLCQQLRYLAEDGDHIHMFAGLELFGGAPFPLKCREQEVPITSVQLNCIDPDDFEESPFNRA